MPLLGLIGRAAAGNGEHGLREPRGERGFSVFRVPSRRSGAEAPDFHLMAVPVWRAWRLGPLSGAVAVTISQIVGSVHLWGQRTTLNSVT
jgi:hypothetical protein